MIFLVFMTDGHAYEVGALSPTQLESYIVHYRWIKALNDGRMLNTEHIVSYKFQYRMPVIHD